MSRDEDQDRVTGAGLKNEALKALACRLGLGEAVKPRRDLDDLAGTWVTDPESDIAMRDLDRVDCDF